eukprot:jgi/Mesen1/9732/ME000695S09048
MAAGDNLSGPTLFQGVDKTSNAFKLLKKMGWEEGTGLGKNRQGIVTHVRVAKKADTSGELLLSFFLILMLASVPLLAAPVQ